MNFLHRFLVSDAPPAVILILVGAGAWSLDACLTGNETKQI
ncbi:MAG: hypothetical protein ABJA66_05510 [Actinomycetota bacterium]